MKNVSITCFSLIFACSVLTIGCIHTSLNLVGGESWQLPQGPQLTSINGFEPTDGGFYISKTNAVTLANNVDEMKAYIDKLEQLIDKMKEYYK